ncbi:Clathrin light chain [Polyrhizophydium stewartii]|uniref:Clathrin light chain n=1 Tax=Polyrhizophydium stewartii TaxID=2732419 RepID=A0ABR4N835_9FUNG
MDSFFVDDSDPTADFLAREQAALGADGPLFGNPITSAAAAPGPAADPRPHRPRGRRQVSSCQSGGSVFAQPDPAASVFVPEIDPEPIREWRERFNATVADRDARSRDKHEQILAQAKESLERFYAEYSEKKAKSISRNKELEKTLIAARDDSTSGTIWERVVKQIETTQAAKDKKDDKKDKKNKGPADASAQKPKGRDTARFKQLLLSLRSDKNAPTVA